MISAGYKSAYQQGYSDAMRDFRKKSKTDILDQIRAEIEQIELLARYTRGDIKQMALDVIDKYKAESEANNG